MRASKGRDMTTAPRLKVHYCLKCRETMDETICPVHGMRTYPNAQIRRFPRYSKAMLAAMKAIKESRKRNEDAWVTRPYQGGLMNGR